MVNKSTFETLNTTLIPGKFLTIATLRNGENNKRYDIYPSFTYKSPYKENHYRIVKEITEDKIEYFYYQLEAGAVISSVSKDNLSDIGMIFNDDLALDFCKTPVPLARVFRKVFTHNGSLRRGTTKIHRGYEYFFAGKLFNDVDNVIFKTNPNTKTVHGVIHATDLQLGDVWSFEKHEREEKIQKQPESTLVKSSVSDESQKISKQVSHEDDVTEKGKTVENSKSLSATAAYFMMNTHKYRILECTDPYSNSKGHLFVMKRKDLPRYLENCNSCDVVVSGVGAHYSCVKVLEPSEYSSKLVDNKPISIAHTYIKHNIGKLSKYNDAWVQIRKEIQNLENQKYDSENNVKNILKINGYETKKKVGLNPLTWLGVDNSMMSKFRRALMAVILAGGTYNSYPMVDNFTGGRISNVAETLMNYVSSSHEEKKLTGNKFHDIWG